MSNAAKMISPSASGTTQEQLVHHVLTLANPANAVSLEVHTTEPGLQLYTGNYLSNVVGKKGVISDKFCGVCLETQRFPDCVNSEAELGCNGFLRPGEVFQSETIFRFFRKMSTSLK
ncbi:unnamed protein product [Amoebophrya sp. A25]|nr:unnamed protein product [Amoebophrya sp. A25]|eukprot:GSA25T00009210001.1